LTSSVSSQKRDSAGGIGNEFTVDLRDNLAGFKAGLLRGHTREYLFHYHAGWHLLFRVREVPELHAKITPPGGKRTVCSEDQADREKEPLDH
jgi:hypothetical protein